MLSLTMPSIISGGRPSLPRAAACFDVLPYRWAIAWSRRCGGNSLPEFRKNAFAIARSLRCLDFIPAPSTFEQQAGARPVSQPLAPARTADGDRKTTQQNDLTFQHEARLPGRACEFLSLRSWAAAGSLWTFSGRNRSIEAVAKFRNVISISLPVRDIGNILDAVDAFARAPNGGLVLPTDLTTIVNRDLIVALAVRYRLPALYSFRSDVASGGLMSFGPDTTNLFVRSAS